MLWSGAGEHPAQFHEKNLNAGEGKRESKEKSSRYFLCGEVSAFRIYLERPVNMRDKTILTSWSDHIKNHCYI